MQVFIIDDEPKIRHGLEKAIAAFKPEWPHPQIAASAEEALLNPIFYKADILFLDVQLPGMSGLDLLDIMQKNEVSLHTVMVSAYAEFSFAQKALSYNVADYLLKPVSLSKLQSILLKTEKNISSERQKLLFNIDDLHAKREKLLSELLDFQIVYTDSNFNNLLLQVGMEDSSFMIIDVSLSPVNSSSDMVFNIISQIISTQNYSIRPIKITSFSQSTIYIILGTHLQLQSFYSIINTTNYTVEETVLVSPVHTSLRELSIAYQECLNSSPIWFTNDETLYIDSILSEKVRLRPAIIKTIDLIAKKYSSQISLSSLASEIHFHQSYLSNLFKKETKVGLLTFINDYRLFVAKKLLANTDDKIISIAENVGFSDYHYFSQVFTRRVGVSPRDYRIQHKSK